VSVALYFARLSSKLEIRGVSRDCCFVRLDEMTFVRYFIWIVGGALVASAIGGLFACIVALISPEFVASLFSRDAAAASLVRYAAAVGMIWGVFLGTAVMGFSLLLVTLVHIARVIRKKAEAQDLP
jgi:hypothetical protein